LYWQVNKLKGSSQSGLLLVKGRNGVTISDKKSVKERRAEHFENVLNWDKVIGKEMKENEKNCDTLYVKEDLFCEEKLVSVLKILKNNKAPDADRVVNEFLKYGGYEIRNKLLKIMNRTLVQGEVPSDFKKTLIKPSRKKKPKMLSSALNCTLNYKGKRCATKSPVRRQS
jgi:hypothetical protein